MKKRVACLLVHGLGGTPFEMRPLVPALEALGYSCCLPLLPGHGTSMEDFATTGYTEWLDCVLHEYDALDEAFDAVAVIGFSLGGALALHLASLRHPAAVVALAPPARIWSVIPWRMPDWRLPFAGLLQYVKPVIFTGGRSQESRDIAPAEGYEGAHAPGVLHRFSRGLAQMRRSLPFSEAPVLIMASRDDRYAPPKDAFYLAGRAGSRDVEVRLLHVPGRIAPHRITTHVACSFYVAETTAAFVKRALEGI